MKTEPSTSSTTPPVLPKRGEPEINPPPSVTGNLAWGVHWPWHKALPIFELVEKCVGFIRELIISEKITRAARTVVCYTRHHRQLPFIRSGLWNSMHYVRVNPVVDFCDHVSDYHGIRTTKCFCINGYDPHNVVSCKTVVYPQRVSYRHITIVC